MEARFFGMGLVFLDPTTEDQQMLRRLFSGPVKISWGEGCMRIEPTAATTTDASVEQHQLLICPRCNKPLSPFLDADKPELLMVTCTNCGFTGKRDEVEPKN